MKPNYGDVTVTVLDNFVAVCEINRAPNNFFDQALIADLADAFEPLIKTQQPARSYSALKANTFVLAQTLAAQSEGNPATPLTPTRSTLRRFDCSARKRL